MFEIMGRKMDDNDDDTEYNSKYIKMSNNSTTIVDMICDKSFDRDIKINEINFHLFLIFQN
jgi:hypothetical protein